MSPESPEDIELTRRTVLVSSLLLDRSCSRMHHNHPVQRRLLSLLLKATSPQIHGHPRPRPLRSLSCSTPLAIRTQHSRLWTSLPILLPTHEISTLSSIRLQRRSLSRRGFCWNSIRGSQAYFSNHHKAIRPSTATHQNPRRYTQDSPKWLRRPSSSTICLSINEEHQPTSS